MLSSYIKSALSRLVQNIKKPFEEKKLADFIQEEQTFIAQQFPDNSSHKKGTAIIKCDDIGDFLMWQQVIPYIKEHAEKPIYFIGNKSLQQLIENKFNFADAYIWIDKKRWDDKNYRTEQYKAIHNLQANVAFTTLFTRHLKMDDLLLVASNAKQRIAWDISHHTYFSKIKNIQNITTQTLKSNKKIELEYFRNIEFINLVYNSNYSKEIKPLYTHYNKKNEITILPVANAKSRCWNPENFITVIKQMEPLFDSINILGGNDGITTCEYIYKNINSTKVKNLCGKTSLDEMIDIIGNSKLVLCPDTSALHIAVLTETDVVLLSNGTNWQRFTNYAPYSKNKINVMFPPYFKPVFEKVKLQYTRSEINSITPDAVIKSIKQILN